MAFEAAGTPDVKNLYARLGTGSPNFCFAGHTDVVPVGDLDAWTVDPFGAEIHDGVLYGRGAADMKGAIAAFVGAVSRFLDRRGNAFDGSISLLITGDEEGPAINGTVKVLRWMEERGERDRRLPGRRADQPDAARRDDQDRAPRQSLGLAHGARRAGPHRLSAACRQPAAASCAHAVRACRHAHRRRHRPLSAEQSPAHHGRRGERGDQRHPGGGARRVQHPFQRPAHGRRHTGMGARTSRFRRGRVRAGYAPHRRVLPHAAPAG